jgi:hypothetical protein
MICHLGFAKQKNYNRERRWHETNVADRAMSTGKRLSLSTKYPLSSVLIYNGTIVAHYALGGIGIILSYGSWFGNTLGAIYLVFSFFETYIQMPLKVCRNCVYYRLDNSLCISGLNLISRKFAEEGSIKVFSSRAAGRFLPE